MHNILQIACKDTKKKVIMQVKDFFFKKALAFIQSMVGCDIIHLVVVYFLKTKKGLLGSPLTLLQVCLFYPR